VDAPECTPSTDAGLTPPQSIASISDDRLFTVAEICSLLRIRKSDVYRACDQGSLEYVKFEGAVQVEGRDLKSWVPGASTLQGPT
jgi:excisionase family DNA binding protein